MTKTSVIKPSTKKPAEVKPADPKLSEDEATETQQFTPVTPDAFSMDARENVIEQLLNGAGKIGFSCGFADGYNMLFQDISRSQKGMGKMRAATVEKLKKYLAERYENNVRKCLDESTVVMGMGVLPDEDSITYH